MLRRAVISCHNGKTLSIKANHSNSNILCIQALLNFHSKNINVSSSKDDVDGLGVPESISPQGVQGKLFSADSSSICNLNQQWMSTCLNHSKRAQPSLQGVPDGTGMSNKSMSSFQAAEKEDNLASLFQ